MNDPAFLGPRHSSIPAPAAPPSVQLDMFRLLVEGVTDYAIFMLSPEGIVITWNAGAQRIKGYTTEEIVGQHFSKFYPPEALAKGWPDDELKRARESGRFEDEGWRVRKDGTTFWANVVITALRSPEGKIVGFSKITRDLTERRAHEEALKQSEQNFRLLIEGVKDHAIVLLDPKGAVLSWNAGGQRVSGYLQDEVVGHSVAMFYPREDLLAGKPEQHLDSARGVGYFEETAWRMKRGGERFWAYSAITALRREDGSLRGFAMVTRDLSEQRRVMELETEGRRVTEFIAMLAHELRNPLAPIRNAVGVMQKEALSPQLKWCRDMIGRQVDHLARLVDDLLDVSRITSGKIQLERIPLDLASLVGAAIESMRTTIDAAGHAVDLRTAHGSMQFTGDPIRLSQVIVNLLTNAAKYTPRGGTIRVELERAGGRIYLRVRDNGIGMSEELIDRVFDMFVQGERALDRSGGGLGIGLTLVKRIAVLHGGTVTASSPGPGQGSEFLVSLPSAENEVAPVQPMAAPSQSLEPRSILVVDDNVDAAESLAILLSASGHSVRVAHDGAQAEQLAASEPPELVLLDIGLPNMNGYEVARRMRSMPGLEDTRLVAMTGYGQESDKTTAAEAGFDGYLVKPVDFAALLETIESLEHSAPPTAGH